MECTQVYNLPATWLASPREKFQRTGRELRGDIYIYESAGAVWTLIFLFNKYFPAGWETQVYCTAGAEQQGMYSTPPYIFLEYEIPSSQPSQSSCWASTLCFQPFGLGPPQSTLLSQTRANLSSQDSVLYHCFLIAEKSTSSIQTIYFLF